MSHAPTSIDVAFLPKGADLNDLVLSGVYAVEAPTNGPSSADAFVLVFEREWGGDYPKLVVQMTFAQGASTFYLRRKNSGTWSSWTNMSGGSMTGAEIVAAIDAQLSSSVWQGGTISGADIVSAIDTELGSSTWQGGGGGSSWSGDRFAQVPSNTFPTILGTNSTLPTVTSTAGEGFVLTMGGSLLASDNVRCAFKAAPAGTSWSAIFRLRASTWNMNYAIAGVSLQDSATGRLVIFGYNGDALVYIRFNNQTTYQDTPWTSEKLPPWMPEWFKITRTATTIKFSVSQDGVNWVNAVERTISTDFANDPDRVGLALDVFRSSGNWPPAEGTDNVAHLLWYNDPDVTL